MCAEKKRLETIVFLLGIKPYTLMKKKRGCIKEHEKVKRKVARST